VANFCEHVNEPLDSTTSWEIHKLLHRAYQEGLSKTELISKSPVMIPIGVKMILSMQYCR
jgi:hypothetical protein